MMLSKQAVPAWKAVNASVVYCLCLFPPIDLLRIPAARLKVGASAGNCPRKRYIIARSTDISFARGAKPQKITMPDTRKA